MIFFLAIFIKEIKILKMLSPRRSSQQHYFLNKLFVLEQFCALRTFIHEWMHTLLLSQVYTFPDFLSFSLMFSICSMIPSTILPYIWLSWLLRLLFPLNFSVFPCFLTTWTVLRSAGQILCRMKFTWIHCLQTG